MNIIDRHLPFGSMNMSNDPNTIIIHHLEAEGVNWTVEQINTMHVCERGWAGIGYHYYIRLDGSVYKGRPDYAVGAHCQGCNTNTLGVAFEGNYDVRTEMPEPQFNTWCELKLDLCNKYGNMAVYGHRDNPNTPGSSECPGQYFPLDKCKIATAKADTKYGWNVDETGWWYCTDVANGYYYKEAWRKIEGEWYYFDNKGYAKQNTWFRDTDNKWYWLKPNCVMGKSEWIWIDSECYCFDEHGVLYINCKTPDGYYVDETGAWFNVKK